MSDRININANNILSFLHPEGDHNAVSSFRVSGDGIKHTYESGKIAEKNDALTKRDDAKKRAMQIVKDTLESELDLDDSLRKVQSRNNELLDNIKNELYAAADDRDHLAKVEKMAGIDPDCEEAKDLEFLKRAADDPFKLSFSFEEKQRLNKLNEKREKGELTPYQQSAISTYESMKAHEKNASDAEAEFRANTASLRAASIERLKSAPMADAVKEADVLSKAADDALISDLLNEAKEHIDKERKEKEEAAKEAKEKQEKLDEKIEKTKLEREEAELRAEISRAEHDAKSDPEAHIDRLSHDNAATEDMINNITDPVTVQNKINAEIEKMLDELKLIQQDIAGSAIDKHV